MKKGVVAISVIVLLATVVIGIFYQTQDLEFAGAGVNELTASGMDLTVLACNPSIFPQKIEQIQAVLYLRSNQIGTLDVTGKTVPSGSQATMEGAITFSDFNSMKNFVSWVLDDKNPSDFKATVSVKTEVLGLIPHFYQKSYDLPRFANLIFGSQESSCKSKLGTTDIKKQLTLIQARLSAAELLYSSNGFIYNNTTKNSNYTNSNKVPILNP